MVGRRLLLVWFYYWLSLVCYFLTSLLNVLNDYSISTHSLWPLLSSAPHSLISFIAHLPFTTPSPHTLPPSLQLPHLHLLPYVPSHRPPAAALSFLFGVVFTWGRCGAVLVGCHWSPFGGCEPKTLEIKITWDASLAGKRERWLIIVRFSIVL